MQFTRRIKFVFGAFFFVRFIFTVHLWYRYLVFVSHTDSLKWWTFVEAVDDDQAISYLPYSEFSQSNRFYQRFLFSSCLDYRVSWDKTFSYTDSLCSVRSQDNRHFSVTLLPGHVWSDGRPLSLDDLYFTYRTLVIDNYWNLDWLSIYSDVVISTGDNGIDVIFPDSSIDNSMFFTYFVLPKHVVQGLSYDDYLELYRTKPVWSECSRIRPQRVDDTSLVFDLGSCNHTPLLFYQLQFLSPDPSVNVSRISDGLYDLITTSKDLGTLLDYRKLSIPSREYNVIFFNSLSDKLTSKINRALWWLIFNNFYTTSDYEPYLLKDHIIFDRFLSTGDSVEKYLVAKNPWLPLDKYDLEKISVQALPQVVFLTSSVDFTFFLEDFQWYKTVKFQLPDGYDKILIQANGGEFYIPKTFDPTSDSFFYSLATYNNNIAEWLNKYLIQWVREGVTQDIATLDLYYLTSPLKDRENIISDSEKIKILYFSDPVSRFVVERLQQIFMDNSLQNYFSFQAFDDVDQFDWKLLSMDYDIVIRTVDLGQRWDLSSLLWSKVPTINPSVYSYDPFIAALSQYGHWERSESLLSTLQTIYMQNVPFVVLGNIHDTVYIRDTTASQLSGSLLGMYDFKSAVLNSTILSEQQSLLWSDVFNFDKLQDFVWSF